MPVTSQKIKELIAAELASLADIRVVTHIQNLLVEPMKELRDWDYGSLGEKFPCWMVLTHQASNTGIAYSEFGFGPGSPWGLVSLSGPGQMSMGMDSQWFSTFLDAYFESMAATELPIWRAFKQDGDIYPGVAVTEEADWDSTWQAIFKLREEDPAAGYHCSQSIYIPQREV